MKILSRLCSALLFTMLCLLLISGCVGSTSDSGNITNDVESVQEESADAEAEVEANDASYSTVTISTYDVDESGNQELSGTETLDSEGNVLEIYAKGMFWDASDDEEEDYEYRQSWSYNSDGLVCGYAKEFIYTESSVASETAEYEYQYDADGRLSAIECTDIELYKDESSYTRTVIADITYNTEGSVSSIGIWSDSWAEYDAESGEEEVYENGNSSDLFSGLVIDLTYYFDQITGMTISGGWCEDGEVECEGSEDGPYSRVLECNDEGLITAIESDPRNANDATYTSATTGCPTTYIGSIDTYGDSWPQLFYRALEYVDALQGTQLASFGSYLLYGTYQLDDDIVISSCNLEFATYDKIMVEYDSGGNKTSQRFYEEHGIETKLEIHYNYEYEYDEYGRISMMYRSAWNDYGTGDLEQTCVSYYEYD